MHDFVRAATTLAAPDLSLDVAINHDRRWSTVFAGPLPEAHDAAYAHVRSSAVQEVQASFDLVVSTNGGYPLDRNLYQAVKGMAAAERIVREGGIVVMAAACEDGVPAVARSPGCSPARPPRVTWPAPPGTPSSTVGRPRSSAGCSPGPRCTCTPGASTIGRSPAHCSSRPPTSARPSRGPGALGPGARTAVIPEGRLTAATVRPGA